MSEVRSSDPVAPSSTEAAISSVVHDHSTTGHNPTTTVPATESLGDTGALSSTETPAVATTGTTTTEASAIQPVGGSEAITHDAGTGNAAVGTTTGETTSTSTPMRHGLLGIKLPPFPFYFKKRYFWLQDTPVAHENLQKYLSKEKNFSVAHANYAHATQTGKGLLFWGKSEKDKEHEKPSGMFNLVGATITSPGNDRINLKSSTGHEVQLETLHTYRDSWLQAIKEDSAAATEANPSLLESEGYKAAHARVGSRPPTTTLTKSTAAEHERAEEGAAIATGAGAGAAVGAHFNEKAAQKKAKKEKKRDEDTSSSSSSSDDEERRRTAQGTGAVGTGLAAGSVSAAAAEKLEGKKEEKRSASKTRQRFSFFGGKKDEERAKSQERKRSVAADSPVTATTAAAAAPLATTTGTEHSTTAPVATEPVAAAPITTAPASDVHTNSTAEPAVTTSSATAPETSHHAITDTSALGSTAPLAAESTPATTAVEEERAVPSTTSGVTSSEPIVSPKASNRKSFLGGFGFGKKKEVVTPKDEVTPVTGETSASGAPVIPEAVLGDSNTPATTATAVAHDTTTAHTEATPALSEPLGTQPISHSTGHEEAISAPTTTAATTTGSALPSTSTAQGTAKSSIIDNIKGKLMSKPTANAIFSSEAKETPSTVGTTTTEPTTTGTTTGLAGTTPAAADVKTPENERKSSFFGFGGRKDSTKGDVEDSKPKRSFSIFKANKKAETPMSEEPAASTTAESVPAAATSTENTTIEPTTKVTDPTTSIPETQTTSDALPAASSHETPAGATHQAPGSVV